MRKALYLVVFVFIICGCQKRESVSGNEMKDMDSISSNRIILFENSVDNLTLFIENENDDFISVLYDEGIIKIEADYHNMYEENPSASVMDLNNDGKEEIVVVNRKYTGSITSYDLYVAYKEDEWSVVSVGDINDLVTASINYEYDELDNSMLFKSGIESVELSLPEWAEEFTFTGNVDYDKRYRYNLDTLKLEVVPFINMEDSLPVTDLSIFFNIKWQNDEVHVEFDHFAIHNESTDFWYEPQDKTISDNQEIGKASELSYDNCDMNLDNWIGSYSFFEHAKGDEIPMNMEYKIEICKEEDAYYAYYYQCGQNFYLNNKGRVYGSNEWISIIFGETLDDNTYFDEIHDEVIISLRMDGDKIYTYWGEYTEPLLVDNRHSEIVCITRDDDKSWATDNTYEYKSWIGKYSCNADSKEQFTIEIVSENDTCYGNVYQGDILICQTNLYGDENWLSLISMSDDSYGRIKKGDVVILLRKNENNIVAYEGAIKRYIN